MSALDLNPVSATTPPLRIGFIGCGRLGKALALSLDRAGLQVICASSNKPADAQALATRIPGCQVVSSQQVADHCDLVFITTSDKAIASTAAALRWRKGQAVVHCSGVTEVQALAAAREQGADVGGFHPMQTFGDPEAAVKALPGSTITVEADEPLNGWLIDLTERLGCRVNRLPPGMRARYHAAAGFTSQFINVLFDQAATVWGTWGASKQDALQALMPMARGTLSSIESAGIAKGMPGPVSRGDVASVDKHLAALAELGPDMLHFYRTLCSRTVPLATECGAIDDATAARLMTALGGAKTTQS